MLFTVRLCTGVTKPHVHVTYYIHNFSTSNPWPFVFWNVWALKNTGLISQMWILHSWKFRQIIFTDVCIWRNFLVSLVTFLCPKFQLKNQNQNILKISSNDRVVMLKNPLQITCDMQRISSNTRFVFLRIKIRICILKISSNHSVHSEKTWFDKLFDLQTLELKLKSTQHLGR